MDLAVEMLDSDNYELLTMKVSAWMVMTLLYFDDDNHTLFCHQLLIIARIVCV